MAHSHILQIGAIYGFPKGPTYPHAYSLTSRLLAPLTEELVLGSCGPRFIMGDFNATPGDRSHLEAFDTWLRMGWRSVQDYAAQVLQWTPQNTCKGATNRDMIWASPEALALMHDIRLQDRFADHSTLSIGLRLQAHIPRLLHWPKPRHIPWHLVKDSWDPPSPATPSTPASTTARFAHLWSTIEGSLQGHIQRPECPSLTAQEQGRGQRTAPMPARPHIDFLRPHRPGEVALRNDLAGTAVRQWYRQLRRLQSFNHAIQAGSTTDTAILHRAELWGAINRAKGFAPSWPIWWDQHRQHGWDIAPFTWPSAQPTAPQQALIFQAFRLNFQRFEAWHLRQRSQSLRDNQSNSTPASSSSTLPITLSSHPTGRRSSPRHHKEACSSGLPTKGPSTSIGNGHTALPP